MITLPRLYLAGPMSGLPDFNHPVFNAAALDLREAGYIVTNPAENGLPATAQWLDHMRADIVLMMANRCDGLAVLPAIASSKGGMVEVTLAKGLGLKVMSVCEWLEMAQAEALQ